MEDAQIVELYWMRSESAIAETAEMYGNYCYSIAYGILFDKEDANESVNDTYFAAWDAMPPHRPAILSTFLGKLTRRISINRWHMRHTQKRGGRVIECALEELSCCVPERHLEQAMEAAELEKVVRAFVEALPLKEQQVFVRRYWYLDSIVDICRRYDFSTSMVKVILHRTREKLKNVLIQEEWMV